MTKVEKLTASQLARIERKKRKIANFLMLAEMNDDDKAIRKRNQPREGMIDLESTESTEPLQKKSKPHHLTNEPQLSGDEFEELRKRLRERKKLLTSVPRLILNQIGNDAALQPLCNNSIPLFLNDIQDLLVYALTDNHFYKPRWCTTQKLNHLSKLVVLVVEGVSSYDFSSAESQFPFLQKSDFKVEVVTPAAYNSDLAEELGNVPLNPAQRRQLLESHGTVDNVLQNNKHVKYKMLRAVFPISQGESQGETLPKSDRFPRTQLLLSASQMIAENYPVPLKGALKERYAEYVLTREQYSEVTSMSPMFALDCEMCITSLKSELTRVSVVDEALQVVYDTMVKPDRPIINYLTKYSGITQKKLQDVSTRLEDVQRALQKLLPADAILVGQSLNCDLDALQMMHPYVIDTSVIFNFSGSRERKSKLATIVREFLNEDIQKSKNGHCSIEDSVSSMRLVQLKLQNSVEFGDAVLTGRDEALIQQEAAKLSHIEEGVHNKTITCPQLTSPLLYSTVQVNKTAAILGAQATVNAYSDFDFIREDKKMKTNLAVRVEEDADKTIEKACSLVEQRDFVVVHVKSDSASEKMDQWAENLWEQMPPRGLLVVLLGSVDKMISGLCLSRIKPLQI